MSNKQEKVLNRAIDILEIERRCKALRDKVENTPVVKLD